MTKTLCELLREAGSKDQCVARNWGEEGEDYGGVCLDAANEIERLQTLIKGEFHCPQCGGPLLNLRIMDESMLTADGKARVRDGILTTCLHCQPLRLPDEPSG